MNASSVCLYPLRKERRKINVTYLIFSILNISSQSHTQNPAAIPHAVFPAEIFAAVVRQRMEPTVCCRGGRGLFPVSGPLPDTKIHSQNCRKPLRMQTDITGNWESSVNRQTVSLPIPTLLQLAPTIWQYLITPPGHAVSNVSPLNSKLCLAMLYVSNCLYKTCDRAWEGDIRGRCGEKWLCSPHWHSWYHWIKRCS